MLSVANWPGSCLRSVNCTTLSLDHLEIRLARQTGSHGISTPAGTVPSNQCSPSASPGTRTDAGAWGHMPDDEKPVALALVTKTQMDMLGPSLKVVFRVEEGAEAFAELLRALDSPLASRDLSRQGELPN